MASNALQKVGQTPNLKVMSCKKKKKTGRSTEVIKNDQKTREYVIRHTLCNRIIVLIRLPTGGYCHSFAAAQTHADRHRPVKANTDTPPRSAHTSHFLYSEEVGKKQTVIDRRAPSNPLAPLGGRVPERHVYVLRGPMGMNRRGRGLLLEEKRQKQPAAEDPNLLTGRAASSPRISRVVVTVTVTVVMVTVTVVVVVVAAVVAVALAVVEVENKLYVC